MKLIHHLQHPDISLVCLYCQQNIIENSLDSHLRDDHKIHHDRAVEMLIAMQYAEGVTNHAPDNQPVNTDPGPVVEDQVPVRETIVINDDQR